MLISVYRTVIEHASAKRARYLASHGGLEVGGKCT